MDKLSEKTLARIRDSVPEHLRNNITKVVVNTDEEELAKAALAAPFIAQYKKKKIQKLLKAGKLRRSETVVNEEIVGQLNVYYEREIARAKAAGVLKEPMEDPFYRARMQRIASGRIIKGRALSPEEIIKAQIALTQNDKDKSNR